MQRVRSVARDEVRVRSVAKGEVRVRSVARGQVRCKVRSVARGDITATCTFQTHSEKRRGRGARA